MTRFYDAKDESDLARVESVLHRGGIEYFIAQPAGAVSKQIEVAEEDVPRAEELLMQSARPQVRRTV